MKKTMTVLAAAALLFTSTAFATKGPDANEKVKAAFAKMFSATSSVNWESRNGFYFGSFLVNQVKTEVAYNEDGELVAISRKIVLSQLPLNVSLALNEKYAGYTFAPGVTELSLEGQTSYYIDATNGKQVLSLKAGADGSINVEKKTKL